jgi:hypothetical protein
VIAIRRARLATLLLTCLLGASAIPASPALAATECYDGMPAGITIQGNLTFSGNTSTGGTIRVDGNTVGGNLRCEGNSHAPDLGDNAVSGRSGGQCAAV